jgi:hypothetical protein
MKSTDIHKTEEERWGKEFVKALTIDAQIEKRHPPEPDLMLLKNDGSRIAVEVTQYFLDHKKLSKENDWKRIQWKLHDYLAQLSKENLLRNISANLCFKDKLPSKSQDDQFILELIGFVKNKISEIRFDERTDFVPVEEYKLLKKYLDIVRLKKISFFYPLWNASDLTGGLISLSSKNFLQLINQKNLKYENYDKGRSDEIWLMIVHDTIKTVWSSIAWPEEILELTKNDDSLISQSPYKHIYLFSYESKGYLRLK